MNETGTIRYTWLKAMYAWTIVAAGGFGLGVLFAPELTGSLMGYPAQDPLLFGIAGSVYVAFLVCSILGLRSPLRFAPVLLLQLTYKAVWFLAVFFPALVAGTVPTYGWGLAAIFATFVIGDLVAIPFPYLFAREPGRAATAAGAGTV
jgi:hypothetical protein